MKTTIQNLLFIFVLLSCSTQLKFPKEETSSLKLCLLGDVGKASTAQYNVAQALKYEKCHEIYFLGDIIYPKGIQSSKDPEFKNRFFNYYQELTKQDHHPRLHIILGNHDYNGKPDAWLDVAKEHSEIYFPSRYYWQKKEDLCLIVLDSNGKSFAEQATWLKKQKAFWKDCRFKIALAHHPLFTNGPNHPQATKELASFYEANVLGQFDFLITGHEHVMESLGERKGTQLFISGAGGAVAKNHLPGYLTLEKKDPKSASLIIKIKTISRDGQINVKTY